MDPTPETLLGNGNGLWWIGCRWCNAQPPALPVPDVLRLLAAAQRAGWTFIPRHNGTLRALCPECTRRLVAAGMLEGQGERWAD